jgi:hypothetical protein
MILLGRYWFSISCSSDAPSKRRSPHDGEPSVRPGTRHRMEGAQRRAEPIRNVHGQYPGTVHAILIGQKLRVQGSGPNRLLWVETCAGH